MTFRGQILCRGLLSDAAVQALRDALAEPPRRVRALQVAGTRLWLKQVERPGWQRRVQKGNPRRAFEADRNALRDLGRTGLPVVPVLAEGPDFMLMPDVGRPLSVVIRDPDRSPAEIEAALRAAGEALGALHRAGFSHGRPSLRDICWDRRRATLIDFERFAPQRNRMEGYTLDVLILTHSVFVCGGQRAGMGARAATESYRQVAPRGIWQATQRRAARLFWLRPIATLALALRPGSREPRAIAPTLDFLAQG